MQLVQLAVQIFFENDEISIVNPSKSDQIVIKKLKKQKRFYTISLQYLFQKFCEKSPFVLPYSSFCKLRSFWVVNRKVSTRDTCLCVK